MLAYCKWNISSMFEPKSLVVKNRSVDYERAHICLSLSSLCDTAAGRRRYCNAWYTTKIFSKFQGFSMSFTYCDVFCLKIGEHFIKCRTKRLRSQSELVREEKNKQHRWCPPQKFAIRVLVHAAGLGTCYFRLWPPFFFLVIFCRREKDGIFCHIVCSVVNFLAENWQASSSSNCDPFYVVTLSLSPFYFKETFNSSSSTFWLAKYH